MNLRQIFACLLAFLISGMGGYAQSSKTILLGDTLQPTTLSGKLFERAPGTFELGGVGSFGIDSSYLHFISLDSAYRPTGSSVFKLSNLAIFHGAEQTPDGMLLFGSNSGSAVKYPFLIKSKPDLSVDWYLTFGNLDISQTAFIKTFSENNAFTTFSYSSPANDIVHHIRGDLAGNLISAYSISQDDFRFRFNNGVRVGSFGTHLMAGTAENQNTNETDALLVSWGPDQLKWNVMVDFGASGTEEFRSFTEPKNGQCWAAASHFNTDSSRFESFLCRIDTAGNILSVQKLSLATGTVLMTNLNTSPEGDLVITGITNDFEPTLARFDSTGVLKWTRRWNSPNQSRAGFQGVHWNADGKLVGQFGNLGDIYFAVLDSGDWACNMTEGPALSVQPYTNYTTTSLTFTESLLITNPISLTVDPKTYFLSQQEFCSNPTTAIESAGETEKLRIYPNPVDDWLQIELPEPYSVDLIQIFNPQGQLVQEASFASRLSVRQLPSGYYLLRVLGPDRRAVQRFWKQ